MVISRTHALVLAVLLSSALFAAPARADDAPALHHAPVVTAHLGEDVPIGAAVDRPDRLKRALLVWKGGGGAGEVEFQRSSSAALPYVAVIPGASVRGTKLAYAIELETTSGERLPAFASRADPYEVTVLDGAEDAREDAYLRRLGGRRSVAQTSGEYVNFGTTDGVRDQYYRIEGSYTYRLLGTVSEFGIRAGAVRGTSLVPGESDPGKYDVGLNYGAPRIRIRADDWLHFEGEFLTSVTEVGFSVGGGGAVIFGDAYGSKLVLGGEAIQVFGSRAYSRLDVVASRFLTLSPIVEVTNMPHADRAGVRLVGEAGVDVGAGFRVDLRGGWAARSFDSGGPSFGGGLAYAF